jgi:hypothetical protein
MLLILKQYIPGTIPVKYSTKTYLKENKLPNSITLFLTSIKITASKTVLRFLNAFL